MSLYRRPADVRVFLVEAAEVDDWDRLLSGAAEVCLAALRRSPRIPEGMLGSSLAAGEPAFVDALLANEHVGPGMLDWIAGVLGAGDVKPYIRSLLAHPHLSSRADVRERLAATGDPGVADRAHATGAGGWNWRLRREVLAAAGPAEAVRQACSILEDGARPASDQLYALLLLHEHGRLGEVSAERLRPEVAEVLAGGDVAALRGAAERAMGTDGLIAELREPAPGGRAQYAAAIARRERPDWTALLAAAGTKTRGQGGKPVGKDAAAALVAHPDCPRELRDLLYFRHPAAVAEHAACLDLGLVTAECVERSRPKAVKILVGRGLGRGIGGAALATEASAAVPVLEAMRVRPGQDAAAAREWDAFTKVLSGLVEEHLGGDVRAWRAARALLGDFTGTIPELLVAAASAPLDGEWPDAAGHPATSAPSSLSGARAAFVTMLEAAPDAAHAALLPHLDARTLHDLYRFCAWRPAWPDQAVATAAAAAGTQTERAATLLAPARILAGRPHLRTDSIERLLDVDDPETLVTLFWHAAATDDQRTRIWSSVAAESLFTCHDRTSDLPAHLDSWRHHDLFACPDAAIFRLMLKRVFVIGQVPQLELFLHVWRTWGPEEVAAMLDRTPVTYSTYHRSREQVRELLARPDRAAARAELEALVAEGTGVQGQIAMWRSRRDRAALMAESHRWHWPELLAEHRREPFDDDLVAVLPRASGCPREFLDEARTVLPSWQHQGYRLLMAGTPAEQVLAGIRPSDTDTAGRPWLTIAVQHGRLTWKQVLEHGRPARRVLERLQLDDAGREPLAALMRDTLKGSPDAWLLAVSMLPDFTGTVSELLRTARLAAG
ncbi:hypothetical protein [[Actinomadura] parvosata]|uniref:hypothetical protein n=1 Tax=[Actinomadura] parvosata TaxID=1955412 RepID=UPI001648913E